VVAVGWRLGRRVQREVERRTRHVLHLANLPTATDVRRLSEQVSALQRELRELQDRRP
jgi:polyhydroxyalkanoate synthesis regulator phasin